MKGMATLNECRSALDLVSARITQFDEAQRRAHIVERTISLTISDLDSVFDMRLTPHGLVDITPRPSTAAATAPKCVSRSAATTLSRWPKTAWTTPKPCSLVASK